MSLVVHWLPSPQGMLLGVWVQPTTGSHESVVHTLPSSHAVPPEPMHTPLLHVSVGVHWLPSLHGAVLLVCTQPIVGWHESSVYELPSSQLGAAPPTHAPPEQVSPVVHASPSLQGAVLAACQQPVAGEQPSVVQTLLSSQLGAGPPVHEPAEQTSLVVHWLPSSHGRLLAE